MAERCRRCYVSGRVQGVGFRAATRERGQALGLIVHARNLDNGTVEVIARGEPQALDELCNWLRRGPRFARVEAVRCEALDEAHWPGMDG